MQSQENVRNWASRVGWSRESGCRAQMDGLPPPACSLVTVTTRGHKSIPGQCQQEGNR